MSSRVALDTNILLRLAHPAAQHHAKAVEAVTVLHRRGYPIVCTTQNIIEFWSVTTRPAYANGFSMTPSEAASRVRFLQRDLIVLPENDRIFPAWLALVLDHAVSGRQVHDARLAATLQVHGVTRLLTWDAQDFTRYPLLTTMTPEDVLAGLF